MGHDWPVPYCYWISCINRRPGWLLHEQEKPLLLKGQRLFPCGNAYSFKVCKPAGRDFHPRGAAYPAGGRGASWGGGGKGALGTGALFICTNCTVAIKRSPSVRTENWPPQASVKLLAMDSPRPLPSVVPVLVPPDKPGGEILAVHSNLVAGNVADAHYRTAVLAGQGHVSP